MKRGKNYSKKLKFLSLIINLNTILVFKLNQKNMKNCKFKKIHYSIYYFRLLAYFEAEEKINVK